MSKEVEFITLGSLIDNVPLFDVHLVDDEVEHEMATIVRLDKTTLTDVGKVKFASTLNARVVDIHQGYLGTYITINGARVRNIEEFMFSLAGECSQENYDLWFNDEKN
jgi:hypothetical protein